MAAGRAERRAAAGLALERLVLGVVLVGADLGEAHVAEAVAARRVAAVHAVAPVVAVVRDRRAALGALLARARDGLRGSAVLDGLGAADVARRPVAAAIRAKDGAARRAGAADDPRSS